MAINFNYFLNIDYKQGNLLIKKMEADFNG